MSLSLFYADKFIVTLPQPTPSPAPGHWAVPAWPGQQQHWTQIHGFVFVWILSPVYLSLDYKSIHKL